MKPDIARWVAFIIGVAIGLLVHQAKAVDRVQVPAVSARYRLAVEHAAGERFGLDAPVARLAAQLHQESGWNPRAASPYAQGLAQFTPPTAAWLPRICPDIGQPDPWDAQWSIRAAACYDAWLLSRAPGGSACDRWAMTLSAYNGGEGTRNRERQYAYDARDEPDTWFGHVERYRARGLAAWQENRTYVRRILLVIEPAYLTAGWPGAGVCT